MPTEQQQFDNRNTNKKQLNTNKSHVFFKERDIFFIAMWKNIHFEQNGKWTDFSRPIVVIKKFNNDIFRWIALSTKIKSGKYYYNFSLNQIQQSAILSQLRLYDSKRIIKKIWMINEQDFFALKQKIKSLL